MTKVSMQKVKVPETEEGKRAHAMKWAVLNRVSLGKEVAMRVNGRPVIAVTGRRGAVTIGRFILLRVRGERLKAVEWVRFTDTRAQILYLLIGEHYPAELARLEQMTANIDPAHDFTIDWQ